MSFSREAGAESQAPVENQFDWDAHDVGHLALHQIEPAEAEQVVINRPLDLGSQLRNGEERFAQLGETDTGRILVVITTGLLNSKIRVVTAYPAKERLRRYFESHKRRSNVGRIEAQDLRE